MDLIDVVSRIPLSVPSILSISLFSLVPYSWRLVVPEINYQSFPNS